MSDSSLGEAVLDLRADGSGLDSDLASAEKKTKGWLGGIGDTLKSGIGTALGFGIAGVANKLIGDIGGIIDGAKESAQVQAQLNAVLQSTGGIAGVTADMANNLASSMQETTLFTDEAILSGENLLLTFTNISQDVFPDATQTMLDMSQALGQDTTQSAMQLGKALNDPVRGIAALRKVGVAFTDEQEKQIKTLVESGQTMEAQKMILAELQREFGGSAEAAGKVDQWKVFDNLLADVKENIVGAVLPAVNDLAKTLIGWLTSPEFKAGLAAFLDGMKTALPQALDFVSKQIPPLLEFLGKLANFLWENRGAVAAVAGVLGALSVIGSVVGWISGLIGVVSALGGFLSAVVPIVGAIVAVLGGPLTLIIGAVIAIIALLVAAWTQNWGDIQGKTQAVVQFIVNLVQGFLSAIQQFWSDHGAQIIAVVQGYWNMIQGIFQTAWALISGIVTVALDLLRGDFDAAGRDWQTMMQNVWDGIQRIISGAWTVIQSTVGAALGALWSAISGKMGEIQTNIQTTWNNVIAYLQGLPGQMWTFGWNIVQGIIDGITAQAGAVQAALQGIIDAAIANIKAFLGIQSPSVVMREEVGAQMAAGVRLGFEQGWTDLFGSLDGLRGGWDFKPAFAATGQGMSAAPTVRVYIGTREIRDFVADVTHVTLARTLERKND